MDCYRTGDPEKLIIYNDNLATKWLLCSKIHNVDNRDIATYGSFNNYYDIKKRYCKFAYTEITGYAIELLLDLNRRTDDVVYLENAELAGAWILGMQNKGTDDGSIGSFLYCLNLADRTKSNEVFPFDAGVCIGALSDLYDKTRDIAYLDSAAKGALWLVETMQNSDGSFKPLTILGEPYNSGNAGKKSSSRLNIRDSWYNLNGCHHGKIAIGLLKYYSVSNGGSWLLECVSSLCNWLLSQQDSSGYFSVVSGSKVTFSHTHCYALEALLYAHEYLKDQSLFDAAKLGGDWLIKLQRNDGGIPAWTNTQHFVSYIDISAVAQAVRIWSVLYSETGSSTYGYAMEKALRYLTRMQSTKQGIDTSGGFYLADLDFKVAKYRLKRLYSWPTIFAVHAKNLQHDMAFKKVLGTELW